MFRWSYLALALLLASSTPDVPHGAAPLRSDANAIPTGITLPTFSDIFLSVAGHGDTAQSSLQLRERLEIVRFLDKEFARVVRPLPAENKGYTYLARAPLDENKLARAIARSGRAANPGDTVQITDIRFEQNEIVIDINGGAKHHFHLFQHLHGGISGGPSLPNGQGPDQAPGQAPHPGQVPGTPTGPGHPPGPDEGPGPGSGPAEVPNLPPASAPTSSAQVPPFAPAMGHGATLVLDYGRPLPVMGANDLKHDLSAFLSFDDQHSVAVNWVDTLPPEFRNAIKERRALVGMNADMVLAALGRPDQKVRETNDDGNETEDWIYGRPPGKTVFVTFLNSKVTRVELFP
jgi:hypothetical protein